MPEYVDYAEYYDADHDFTSDHGFYLDYARRNGSPILELACGTGRVLVPLAEAGFEIHSFDLSENMLAICRRKVEENGLEGRVRRFEFKVEEYDGMEALIRERYVPLATRYTFRSELEQLLEKAGFEFLGLYRDYDRRPNDGTGEMIAVARKPG